MASIGRYQVLCRLAQGGMAEVLLGRTTGEGGFEKLVAIKKILSHMASNESFVKMFIDEARISAKLNHSGIAQIFEFGRAGETYFIAMEYIQGVDLRGIHRYYRKVEQQTPPSPLAAYTVTNICSALEYAHTKTDNQGKSLSIVHRDLSPSNVLISFEGEVKLIDFGIAKAAQRMYVTVGPNLKGKYAYMSPEQAAGQAVDHRSDIFGAGILLFELLTGRNPFRAETDLATLQRVQAAKVPSPSRVVPQIPEELDRICLKALARQPEDRFATAGEMQEALEEFSRRSGFGSRQLARLMKEAFQAEREKIQEMVRQSRAQAKSTGLQVVPTDELKDLFSGRAGGKEVVYPLHPRVPTQAVRSIGDQESASGITPAPGLSHEIVVEPILPVRGNPTGPPPQPIQFLLEPGSSPGSGPAPAGAPGPRVAQPAPLQVGPAIDLRGYARERRTNPWLHVGIFILLVAVIGVVVYLLAGRSIQLHSSGGSPLGSVTVSVDPPLPARVFVDDTLHGTMAAGVPYAIKNLLSGRHRVRLEGDGMRTVEKVVEVTEGKTTKLHLAAEPPPAPSPPGEEPGGSSHQQGQPR